MQEAETKHEEKPVARNRRWWRIAGWLALLLLVLVAGAIAYLQSDSFRDLLREKIVAELQLRLGTKVELKVFDFSWWNLTAHLEGFTIQGAPPDRPGKSSTAPSSILTADRVDASWKLLALWPLRADFQSMQIVKPRVHVVFYEDGTSNLPQVQPPANSGQWAQRLIDLRIKRLEIVDGEINWDERRVPLEFSADRVQVDMKHASSAKPIADNMPPGMADERYEGSLSFKNARFEMAKRPVTDISTSMQFKLFPQRAELSEVAVNTPLSSARGFAIVNSLRTLDLSLQYDAHLDWQDVGRWLNARGWQGKIDWRGQGTITSANTSLGGDLAMNTTRMGVADWEHLPWKLRSKLAVTRDSKPAAPGASRAVPLLAKLADLQIDALGGVLSGKAEVMIEGNSARGTSNLSLQSADFPEVASALQQVLPDLERLPWATELSGPIQVSFDAPWRDGHPSLNLEVKADIGLKSPAEMRSALTPVSGNIKTTFVSPGSRFDDMDVAIDLPGTEFRAKGWMHDADSAMQMSLHSTQLEAVKPTVELFWRGFGDLPLKLDGELKTEGVWSGGRRNAKFQGPVNVTQFFYDKNRIDLFSGNLNVRRTGSALDRIPIQLEISSGRVQQGKASADFDGAIILLDGRFEPDSAFHAKGNIRKLDAGTIQSLAGTSFSIEGEVDGSFDVAGTKQHLQGKSTIAIADGQIRGESFSQLTAAIQVEPDPVITINPLKILKGGVVSGRATVRPSEKRFQLDLTASAIPLNEFRLLSSPQLAISGMLDGQITGSGTYERPDLRGEFTLTNAGMGPVREGQLRGEVRSDGNQLQWTAAGPLFGGTASGNGHIALTAPFPMGGNISLQSAEVRTIYSFSQKIPEGISGEVDGKAQFSGNASDAKSITADGQLTRLNIARAGISLSSAAPVNFRYEDQQFRLGSVHLVGPQIDFTTGGTIRTSSDPVMNLSAKGTMNLRLLTNLYPQLTTQGKADLDAQITGSFAKPQWRGRLTLENASAQFGRLANSLSAMSGTIVFDGNRGDLEGFRAESGGGEILIGGALRYGEGSGLQFSLNGTVDNVRVRYPENLSTWIDAQVNWNGSTTSSVLDGRVTIQRQSIAPPNDLAQLLIGGRRARNAVTAADSPFLRNLRLNLTVNSVPEVRLDTRTARNLQTAVEIRIQGTAQQPAVLGRIGVLSGEIEFAGKQYSINRGEITFLNPFRFEPILNLNVQARVQQYDITMDFSGPPDRLNVTYRSDPPLPTRDILALLVAGGARQTSLQPSSQPLPQVTADALLSQALSSQIGSRLDRIFGNGRVRIDPQLNTLSGTASATIALEQQIKNNVTLLYVTDLSAAQQQYVQGEWTISPKLSVVGIRDQNGLVGVNFQITLRFQ